MISHYARKNAPNRRFLNPELSIKQMFENFIENNEIAKFVIGPTAMCLNRRIWDFPDHHKMSVRFISAVMIMTRMYPTTIIINVRYVSNM